MCIYYDEKISEETGNRTNTANHLLKAETMAMTLDEVFKKDFDRNFQESTQSIEPTIAAEVGDTTAFSLNLAGNYSLQHKMALTDDKSCWAIAVNNEGKEDVVI